MTLATKITNILNGTIDSVRSVLPLTLNVQKPALLTQPFTQNEISVLIGITGDVRGRVLIDGEEATISKIGESMFGMPLEGEMLESFAGELGNMIAGNISASVFQNGVTIDITPPTVLVGQSKMYGFEKAFKLPIEIEGVGSLIVLLMLEQSLSS